jgi:hypothetical protein
MFPPVVVSADAGLAPGVAPPFAASTRHRLPATFLVWERTGRTIWGAISVIDCVVIRNSLNYVYWHVNLCVPLQQKLQVARDDISRWSTLVHLRPAAEVRVRQLRAAVGGALNDHFHAAAGDRWPLWSLLPAQLQMLFHGGPGPVTLRTGAELASASRVQPRETRMWGKLHHH